MLPFRTWACVHRPRSQNTNAVNENLSDAGVVARGRENPNGFGEAYFNSQLDAAEFSISRQALIDAGWNGSTKLRYQVFTTKDGTQNEGGGGDIGGRNDLRDTIYDDWLSEDYWSAQAHIAANGKLSSHIEVDSAGRYPDQGKCAKAILLLHANHAILAGSEIQPLINTGHSTGYHRALDAHQAFNQPFALHITPTLASAIQWAAVNPDAEKPWLDGPTFNDQLSLLAQDGRASLLGTTFADHIPRYFTDEFNRDSTTLAGQFFQRIYHALPSTNVLWNPNALRTTSVLGKSPPWALTTPLSTRCVTSGSGKADKPPSPPTATASIVTTASIASSSTNKQAATATRITTMDCPWLCGVSITERQEAERRTK